MTFLQVAIDFLQVGILVAIAWMLRRVPNIASSDRREMARRIEALRSEVEEIKKRK